MFNIKHITETGEVVDFNSKRDYRFASVGTKSDGTVIAYGFHTKAPRSPAFSYFTNCHVEPINGGTR
jgi:hypothetical protein